MVSVQQMSVETGNWWLTSIILVTRRERSGGSQFEDNWGKYS
jgi:hypothetical protein